MATSGVGRVQTTPGVPRQNAASEKLNDERGEKPLLVNWLRDGAESGKLPSDRVRGSFCILPPEIQALVLGKLWRSGSFSHTGAQEGSLGTNQRD